MTRTFTTALPGHIHVPPAMVADALPGIEAKITAHLRAWADAVPVGTRATIFEVLTYDRPCACPPAGWQHLKKCAGFAHGMPLEIVMQVIFPPDGSPCTVPGVTGHRMQGPLEQHALALPVYVERTATP